MKRFVRKIFTIDLIMSVFASLLANALTSWGLYESIGIGFFSFLTFLMLLKLLAPYWAPYCWLRTFGIDSIKEGREINPGISSHVGECNKKLRFMTITGRTSINTAEVEKAIKRKSADRNIDIQILLLDPDSINFKSFCEMEGNSPETVKTKIESVTNAILTWRKEKNILLEVRWYSDLPIWRILLVDDVKAYIGFYSTNRKGYEGAQIEMKANANEPLFSSFSRIFDDCWARARTIPEISQSQLSHISIESSLPNKSIQPIAESLS